MVSDGILVCGLRYSKPSKHGTCLEVTRTTPRYIVISLKAQVGGSLGYPEL